MDRLAHAKAILEDALFVEAFETVRKELLQRWEHSSADEIDARESIWLALQILQKLRLHIESVMTTAEMARVRDSQSPFI